LRQWGESAGLSVQGWDQEACADRMLELYAALVEQHAQSENVDPAPWDRLLRRLGIEWNLLVAKTTALRAAAGDPTVVTAPAAETVD